MAYIDKCAGLEWTPIVALGEVLSAVRSTVVDCPHGFMETIDTMRVLFHIVEERFTRLVGHCKRRFDESILRNWILLHGVRKLAGSRVNIINHMPHHRLHTHRVLRHECRHPAVRDEPWACFFEKAVGHGKLQDSPGSIFIHPNRLGNLRERFLTIYGHLGGYIKPVDGMETGTVMTLCRHQHRMLCRLGRPIHTRTASSKSDSTGPSASW